MNDDYLFYTCLLYTSLVHLRHDPCRRGRHRWVEVPVCPVVDEIARRVGLILSLIHIFMFYIYFCRFTNLYRAGII